MSLGPRLCPDGIERPRYVLAQIVDVEERAAGIYKYVKKSLDEIVGPRNNIPTNETVYPARTHK